MKVILRKSEAKSPFSFIFVSDDGKTIVKSENYVQKASAKNGIQSVKKNSQDTQKYELKTATNGKFFFNLKATNAQIIATSLMFDSQEQRQKYIQELQQNAKDAILEE